MGEHSSHLESMVWLAVTKRSAQIFSNSSAGRSVTVNFKLGVINERTAHFMSGYDEFRPFIEGS